MIYRGLYHFYVAHHKGLAIDPIKYFSAPENRDLADEIALRSPQRAFHQAGIAKSIRKPFKKLILVYHIQDPEGEELK